MGEIVPATVAGTLVVSNAENVARLVIFWIRQLRKPCGLRNRGWEH
ncbi:MAG: hypothetical protein J7L19_02965 [Dehalococcoidia bacterium]|nr:hypothetical protein [Dehalococcoidia bacterium]